MKKLLNDQSGIMLIPIIAGVLVFGAASTFAFNRVKHNQLEKQKNASSLKLQDSIADSSKKLALKEEQKKEDQPAEVKVPPAAETVKPAPVPVVKPAPTTTKPKPTETKPPSTPPSGSLSLSHSGGANVAWTLSGSAPYGLKLVWSGSPGPVYPGSGAKYYSGSSASGAIEAGAGNYYVRICMYHDGKCVNYSNEIYINVP